MPYVSNRWLGGLLTNWRTISDRIAYLHDLRRLKKDGQLALLPAKERITMEAELEKLESNLGGVADMKRQPDAIFIVDLKKEALAVREAQRLHLPVIALVDTNCDPDEADVRDPGQRRRDPLVLAHRPRARRRHRRRPEQGLGEGLRRQGRSRRGGSRRRGRGGSRARGGRRGARGRRAGRSERKGDIEEIEGIGPAFAEKLRAADVSSIDALLEKGATPEGRSALVEQTGIDAVRVLRWVNHADLMRVVGIGPEFAELLEAAGVDSVPELAQRNVENLVTALTETNDARSLVRRVPSAAEVTDWIEQAKALPRVVAH